jgi:hypothetical protein
MGARGMRDLLLECFLYACHGDPHIHMREGQVLGPRVQEDAITARQQSIAT